MADRSTLPSDDRPLVLAHGARISYIQAMSFWKRISPIGAVKDFARQWSRPSPHRWAALGVSAAATFAILYIAVPNPEPAPLEAPKIIYYEGLAPDRTDEEIMAANIANQARQDELRAQQEAREERRRELYRQLGEASGMDMDEIDREIAEEEAAKAIAEDAERADRRARTEEAMRLRAERERANDATR